MYPGLQAKIRPQQPAFIMAQSGDTVTYAELERRTNRLAHFLRASGLGRLDHYAIFMENNARYVECCGAGERTGLYYTCVNSYFSPEELAYILDNSESKVLITSVAKRDVALQALAQCPRVERCLVVDGPGDGARVLNLDAAVGGFPDLPIADEFLGAAIAALRFPDEAVALSRRHDLSLAGAALSLGAAGGGPPDAPHGRHRDHHGAFRSRAISGARRALSRDS
jgi:long-chain acyl-CoA synthetase